MMKFKALVPDAFYVVEAESEAQAEAKAIELFIADLRSKESKAIVWEEAPARRESQPEGR